MPFQPADVQAEFTPDAQQIGTWIADADSDEQAVILEEWMIRSRKFAWGMQVRFIAEALPSQEVARGVVAMLTDLVEAIKEQGTT